MKNTATGMSVDTSSDSNGRYNANKVPAGNYTVTMTVMGQTIYEFVMALEPGQDLTKDVNFKEMQENAGKDQAEEEKKANEAKAKFAAMKKNFDDGKTALETEKATRVQYDKLPKDQQASLQGQLDQQAAVAITSLQNAVDGTGETDPNRGLILATLGDAYETDDNKCDQKPPMPTPRRSRSGRIPAPTTTWATAWLARAKCTLRWPRTKRPSSSIR